MTQRRGTPRSGFPGSFQWRNELELPARGDKILAKKADKSYAKVWHVGPKRCFSLMVLR